MSVPVDFLPIDINSFHESTLECLIIEGTMTRDFGPWKAGEYRTLSFNFDKGQVEEYDEHGVRLHAFFLKLSCGEEVKS